MLSSTHFEISPRLTQCDDSTTTTSDKHFPRTPFRPRYQPPESLPSATSIESLVETNIPSPSLGHDFEISRLMSPVSSPRRSYQHVPDNFPITARPRQPSCHIKPERDHFASIYNCFGVEVNQLGEPNRSHQETRPQSRLLPAPLTEYRRSYDESVQLYSANLRASTTPSSQSPALIPETSCSERSITPSQLERMICGPASAVATDYSPQSSPETRPTTPAHSLVPSLSLASTLRSSPSSIMSYQSAQETSYHYHATTDHIEFGPMTKSQIVPKSKPKATSNAKPKPKRITLCDIQSHNSHSHTKPSQGQGQGTNIRNRTISPPTPSPQYPDAYTAAALSYDRTRCTTSPSPAPTLSTAEVSAFDDDSDDENVNPGRRPFNRLKSAFSSQNIRNVSRARTESAAQEQMPGMMRVVIAGRGVGGGEGDGREKRSSKGSSKHTIPVTPLLHRVGSSTSTEVVRVTSRSTEVTSYHSMSEPELDHHHRGSMVQDRDQDREQEQELAIRSLSPTLSASKVSMKLRKTLSTRSMASSRSLEQKKEKEKEKEKEKKKRQSVLSLSSCFTLEPVGESLRKMHMRRRGEGEKIAANGSGNEKAKRVPSSGKRVKLFVRRARVWMTRMAKRERKMP